MKHIGKIAALAMAMAMALALSACGGSASSSAASSASASAASASASAASASASTAAASSEAASASAASETASAASASAASSETSASAADENLNTYDNEYFNIRFDMPDGWKMANEEEQKELAAAGASPITGLGELDMVAYNADQSIVDMVVLINPGSAASGESAKQLLDKMVDAVNNASTSGSGMTATADPATLTLADGTVIEAVKLTLEQEGGNKMYMGFGALEKDGVYMLINVTSQTEAGLDEGFTPFVSLS
ncbi:MAG TPA: hypothetical protein DCP91_09065 [Eggerthellaceae bacterium]|nr:hypothetical protein [Eggerthellaceae bacterium]